MKESNHLQIMCSTGTHFSRFGIAPEKQMNKICALTLSKMNLEDKPNQFLFINGLKVKTGN